MKSKVLLLLGATALGVYTTFAQTESKQMPDQHLTVEVMERTNRLTRLTAKFIRMEPPYASFCKFPHAAAEQSPHDFAYSHVYMNVPGINALKTGMTNYPVGTLVLKEKRVNQEQVLPSLFTGMIKREKGYNPEAGDWEFFAANGKGNLIVARGRITSCMDCHSKHQKTDYLTESWKKSPAISSIREGNILDHHISQLTAGRSNRLSKLTGKPIPLPDFASRLCGVDASQWPTFKIMSADPNLQPKVDIGDWGHSLARKTRYAQVYISQDAAALAQAKEKKRVYPLGTLVLKEKTTHADGSGTELFTGMLKREAGYNPEGGDWEFLVLSGDATTITARGKIASCLDCHSRHQKTDYLTESWKTAQ
jgi:Zn-finger protein